MMVSVSLLYGWNFSELGIVMFSNFVSRKFKLAYFFSSFTLLYIPILLMITLIQFGVVNTTNSVGVSLVFILLFVLSALSLIYVKLKLSEDRKHVRINSTVFTLQKSKHVYWWNSRSFYLSLFLGFSTLLFLPNLWISLGWILTIQIALGYYLYTASKFLLNVPLLLLGEVLLVDKNETHKLLMFISHKDLKKVYGEKITCIPLGDTENFKLGLFATEN